MKRTIFLAALALAVGMHINSVQAQMMGSESDMMEGYEQQEKAPPVQQNYPYMMYPGMMGGYGYGMGPEMMEGYGMGPCMMGNYGYGMGPGMMERHGYGQHMPRSWGGYGYGEKGQAGSASQEKLNKFLDDTRELRKKLHDMRFEYREMLRNPNTTMKDKMEMEKEMFELQQKIQEKAPQ